MKPIKIADKWIGDNYPCFIIAEAGVNHDGDVEKAKKLIDIAINSGVDAIKFQTSKIGELTGKFASKVDYLNTENHETWHEMSIRLSLSYDDFRFLQQYCKKKGILFLSTPNGKESLDFLIDELNMPIVKISSTEITNLAYIEEIAKKNKPIFLSTGISTLGDIEKCVMIIQKLNNNGLILLHCTSEYPAPYDEVNLNAIITMHKAFKLPVGFSDHTQGIEASIAAVALGSIVIEKHFTLDKKLDGPDHKASLSPDELNQFVRSIRLTEKMLGDGIKRPSPSELRNLSGIRRGVVAAFNLQKGTLLTEDMVKLKRPFIEIGPDKLICVIGRRINRDLSEDEPILWDYIK